MMQSILVMQLLRLASQQLEQPRHGDLWIWTNLLALPNLSGAIGGRVCPLTSDEWMWQRARKVHLANHDACMRKAL